jgi:hypothetical protein
MGKPNCEHWYTEEIRSFGGDLMVFQCTSCLSQVKPCPDCKLPLNARHKAISLGCSSCHKGKFCNVRRPLCEGCAPAQDGICRDCSRPFSQNGRQKRQGKLYCNDTCKGRAYLKRDAKKAEALPAATEGEVTH